MSTSSSVVQLGTVSSMSGPHSILEIGERQEHTLSENDTTESTQKENTSPIENNHLTESAQPTPMNKPQPAHPNDCVPVEDEETPVAADFTTVNKRPPPLEVCF